MWWTRTDRRAPKSDRLHAPPDSASEPKAREAQEPESEVADDSDTDTLDRPRR